MSLEYIAHSPVEDHGKSVLLETSDIDFARNVGASLVRHLGENESDIAQVSKLEELIDSPTGASASIDSDRFVVQVGPNVLSESEDTSYGVRAIATHYGHDPQPIERLQTAFVNSVEQAF